MKKIGKGFVSNESVPPISKNIEMSIRDVYISGLVNIT